MRSWLRGYDRLVTTREDGRVLAALRIAVGVVGAWNILNMIPAEVLDLMWLPPAHGGILSLSRGMWITKNVGTLDPPKVYGMVVVSLSFFALTIVGLGRGFAPLLAALSFYALRSLNPPITGGYDAVLVNILLFLSLADCTRTWSVDCWLRTRRWSSFDLVAAWPRYLIVFQLIILYTATGLKKASFVWSPTGSYSALWYVFIDPTWRRMEHVEFLRWMMPAMRFGTALTWHWEQLSFLLLVLGYYRFTKERPGRLRAFLNRWDLRWPWMAVGVAMHGGVFLMTNVGIFSIISLSLYPALFAPHELDAAWLRLKAWVRRRSRSGSDDGRSRTAAES